ncbi:hypothetical protein O9A_01302 [Bartonella koehlerae C-29]|uniref:Uncharacterized protein n=1 Tax=Bartonella koehlerae C-29 TaxID=1134510 RepID=A0A067WD04_9HYPH|nr:hypothetical protein O9A_01302 [Bartonella koehlerae C-29]
MFSITQTEICETLALIWYRKVGMACVVRNHLNNMRLKNASMLGLDVYFIGKH